MKDVSIIFPDDDIVKILFRNECFFNKRLPVLCNTCFDLFCLHLKIDVDGNRSLIFGARNLKNPLVDIRIDVNHTENSKQPKTSNGF